MVLKLSVSTIPGIIENLSSVLFNGGINKVEYPGGVFISQGFEILCTGWFLFFSIKGLSPNCSLLWNSLLPL